LVEGIDSSPEMIAAAADVPGVSFSIGNAADWQPAGDVDVIVSNAALQWVPRHQQLMTPVGIGATGRRLAGGAGAGQLRLTIALADAVTGRQQVLELGDVIHHRHAIGTPESYAGVLLDAGLVADAWETTYLHALQGQDPVLEWMRGTGLRPLLAALPPHDADKFASQFAARLREAYPPGPHGTQFPFRRIFAVGHRL
jgi:trans-aconitate 2-methyltransferase